MVCRSRQHILPACGLAGLVLVPAYLHGATMRLAGTWFALALWAHLRVQAGEDLCRHWCAPPLPLLVPCCMHLLKISAAETKWLPFNAGAWVGSMTLRCATTSCAPSATGVNRYRRSRWKIRKTMARYVWSGVVVEKGSTRTRIARTAGSKGMPGAKATMSPRSTGYRQARLRGPCQPRAAAVLLES